MKNKKLNLPITILILMMFAAAGCEQMSINPRTRQKIEPTPQPSGVAYMRGTSIVDGEKNNNKGATETAIEWADKYATTAQELLFANQRITEMEAEKKILNTKIAKYTSPF